MIVEFYEDVIQISGALKYNFWDTIHTAISLSLQKHPNGVIVDCSGITECTVQGGDTFRDAMEFISRQSAHIILAAVPEAVYEILKSIPEIRSQLAIAASVEEAHHTMDLAVAAKAKRGKAESAMQVALTLFGAECDIAATKAAVRMARSEKATVHIIFPIVVPRDLALHAPLPIMEDTAIKAAGQAKQHLKDRQIAYVLHIERGRDTGAIISNVCETNNIVYVFVPLPCSNAAVEDAAVTVRSILSRLKCTVSFIRGPIKE
jgi:hypothetical protein